MAIYNQLFVSINGQLLAENTSLSVNIDRRNEDAFTVETGYEGQDVGPPVLVVSGDNVVPAKGAEFQFDESMLSNETVELYLQEGSGGKTLRSEGQITKASRQGGTGTNYIFSFEFRGKPAAFA